MDEVRLPIFIANNEDDDLTIAPSVISALGNMEPPEVSDGHYFVFDASGRQGHLAIEQFNIVITAWTTAADLPALRSRIQKCLVYYHLEIDQNMNDAEYIQRAAPFIFNENIKNQWPKRPRWLRTLVHGKQTLPGKSDVQRDEIGAIPRVGRRHQLCVTGNHQRTSKTRAVHRSDIDRAAMVVLFEFESDLLRYSSGGSVVGVDDRDQVACR